MRLKPKGFIESSTLGAIKGNKMRRLKPKGFIESSTLGVAQGRGGGMGGRMDIRGECGFSSLMKQNKKAKNYAVFCFAGKKNYYFIFML